MSPCYNFSNPLHLPSASYTHHVKTVLSSLDLFFVTICLIVSLILIVYYCNCRGSEVTNIIYLNLISADLVCCLNVVFIFKEPSSSKHVAYIFYILCFVSSRIMLILLSLCRLAQTAYPALYSRLTRCHVYSACAIGWFLGLLRGMAVLKFKGGCEEGGHGTSNNLALSISIEVIELGMILLTAIIQLGTIALLTYYRRTLTGISQQPFNEGIKLLSLFSLSYIFWNILHTDSVLEDLLSLLNNCGTVAGFICATKMDVQAFVFLGCAQSYIIFLHLSQVMFSTTNSLILLTQPSVKSGLVTYFGIARLRLATTYQQMFEDFYDRNYV